MPFYAPHMDSGAYGRVGANVLLSARVWKTVHTSLTILSSNNYTSCLIDTPNHIARVGNWYSCGKW